MKVLLDTHVALRLIADSGKLSSKIIDVLKDKSNTLYYSIVSMWEIAIKYKIHPELIPFGERKFKEYCDEIGLAELNINDDSIFVISSLEDIHKDPFDRMLLSQAITNKMYFATSDNNILKYKYDRLIKA